SWRITRGPRRAAGRRVVFLQREGPGGTIAGAVCVHGVRVLADHLLAARSGRGYTPRKSLHACRARNAPPAGVCAPPRMAPAGMAGAVAFQQVGDLADPSLVARPGRGYTAADLTSAGRGIATPDGVDSQRPRQGSAGPWRFTWIRRVLGGHGSSRRRSSPGS